MLRGWIYFLCLQPRKICYWSELLDDGDSVVAISRYLYQVFLRRSYFSDDGLEYNLGRVPIGGTDFSVRGYSYQDNDTDANLKSFKLSEEDFNYKVCAYL